MKTLKLPPSRDMPKRFEELVRMYPPRAIHDKADFQNAQEIIDRLTSAPRLTKGQKEYLDTLTILLSAYEAAHHSIYAKDISALDALKYLMDQHGMSASDLGRLLGDRSLGSRILREERELSKHHIRKLCDYFQVSADLLWPTTGRF